MQIVSGLGRKHEIVGRGVRWVVTGGGRGGTGGGGGGVVRGGGVGGAGGGVVREPGEMAVTAVPSGSTAAPEPGP